MILCLRFISSTTEGEGGYVITTLCWVVARLPLVSGFPSVCMSVCLYVMDSSGGQRSQPILMKLNGRFIPGSSCMLLSTVPMDATVAEQRDFEIFEKIRKIVFFRKSKIGFRFYAHYNQPLCQKISARSVKNCMTSMQLYYYMLSPQHSRWDSLT